MVKGNKTPIAKVEHNIMIKLSWGCEVCGMEEWCGTDGCPMDPQ